MRILLLLGLTILVSGCGNPFTRAKTLESPPIYWVESGADPETTARCQVDGIKSADYTIEPGVYPAPTDDGFEVLTGARTTFGRDWIFGQITTYQANDAVTLVKIHAQSSADGEIAVQALKTCLEP